MYATFKIEVEREITKVKIEVPVRYDEEQIPYDFPLRSGDMWNAIVDIDSGQIDDWPKGKSGNLFLKVCDSGSYTLIERNGNEPLSIYADYVPHGLIPGEYGDYIDLKINEDGVITNWPSSPDVSEFSGDED